ncbi:bifunctional aminotransferase class I/II-fold pyridoxal phosphate-dependent enzyme/GNAT family N-acetyltransferase [Flavobacteriales bacterium]|nr:bifunctional aminotransferase class I/II-fold pyridoxal phosphate-dependent enzyme/GNAT family N-acetyltransferase [Flavobacteriales bacterium]
MGRYKIYETLEKIAENAKGNGVIHLTTEDKKLTSNSIQIKGENYVNFGSCSYLGLEFNEGIKNGAKQAIDDYGSQFSSSRAYVSPRFYDELETKLSKIFNASAVVTPTTTLGHIAAIPVLVGPNDVVILDHQVHSSVQTAVALVKAKGVKVEMVRHNRMDLLEAKIKEYKGEYDNIWYMADGIYSMYGDAAPLDEVYALMDKYKQFRFYVDDAHGMSCYGKHGRGYVLADREMHNQMVLATSFAKAFATGGGALVFPTKELAMSVRSLGGPMITSGPMQPSALGAAIASADFHLSDEIDECQEDLQENIKYTHLMLKKYKLPNLAADFSPIFFIGVGLPKIAYSLVNKLMKDGFFLNIGIFPAVPIKNTGVRFTITRLHTFEQIENMVKSLASHFLNVLKEEDFSIEQICKAFKIEDVYSEKEEENYVLVNNSDLVLEHTDTILDIPKAQWNSLLGNRGTFDWNGLNLLENSFKNNKLEEENWDFDYLTIKDKEGKVVLTTFLTTALTKDDMLSPEVISYEMEQKRVSDPYFYTSRTLQVGSLLTEGNHIYLDRTSDYWKQAMTMFLAKTSEIQEANNATSVMIRDLSMVDNEMDDFMINNGYFKMEMPENNHIENINWTDDASLKETLSKRSKKHITQDVFRHKNKFEVNVVENCTEEELKKYYELYLNVKSNSLALNTYKLPYELFSKFATNDDWEFITLNLKPEFVKGGKNEPVAVSICHKGEKSYSFLLVGIDYETNREHNTYRQAMYRVLLRAKELGYNKVDLGYSATTEKRKFGAKQVQSCAYMQVKDNFNMESLNALSVSKSIKKSRI